MVAILTQWLNNTLNRLEAGLTPIRMSGHIAILGWTNRTRAICRELVVSQGRVDRWLALGGIRRLRIAVLAQKIGPDRDQELKDALGKHYRRHQFVLRSGDVLRSSHLKRVDIVHAGGIVLPGIDATAADAPNHDDAVIKALRSISAEQSGNDELPRCICEIIDPRKAAVARRAYEGPVDVVSSDVVIGRLLGDSLRQPGLSAVCHELVTHGVGGTLYIRTWEHDATTFGSLRKRSSRSILLGFVRDGRFCMAPEDDTSVETDDALVFVAHNYDATDPSSEETETETIPDLAVRTAEDRSAGGRVLVLGWSRRVPDLLAELDTYSDEKWHVDVFSAVSRERREQDMFEHAVTLEHTAIRHHVADITVPMTLAEAQPGHYDRILLVANDWVSTGPAADARTISAYVALTAVMDDTATHPPVLVELADVGNNAMFDRSQAEVVVSSQILSRVLAQGILRYELLVVIDNIFGAGNGELSFGTLQDTPGTTFAHASEAVRRAGGVAIGLRRGGLGGEIVLAPELTTTVECGEGDVLIVVRQEAAPHPDHGELPLQANAFTSDAHTLQPTQPDSP